MEGIARFETVYDIATKKRNGLENQIDNPKVDPLSENWTTPNEFRELITISGNDRWLFSMRKHLVFIS